MDAAGARYAMMADLGLAGERKLVTVLFADIEGSTEVASRLDPEDWFLVLERFHAAATDSINRSGGVVTLYAGDGLTALFGAPIADEHHAAQACWAALRLNEQMETIAEELAPAIGTSLGVRIGLNSGTVVVGRIGGETRTDYTAQGLPVHIAARMEQIADAGAIFVAPDAAALVADRFELEVVGERAVKGIADPILVRRLVGPIAERGAAPASASTVPFVGRDADLALLHAALSDARAGTAVAVGIHAAAGCGKSRLVTEWLDRVNDSDDHVVTIVVDALGAPVPTSIARELARSVLPAGESVPDALDGTALRALLVARAQEADGALVVVIDDLHALDAASQVAVGEVLSPPLAAPVLFVLTSRVAGELAAVLPYESVCIDLLSFRADETQRIVAEWVVDPAESFELAGYLHERTGGNPFFLEESLRSLVESEQLVGAPGARRLAGPLSGLEVPARVQTVIAARIDRLERDQRDLLYAAAVIGMEFDRATLGATANLDPVETTRLLDDVVTANLLRAIGGSRFAFRHRITQQVAYDAQLREQRRRRHALAAAVLDARDAEGGA